MTRVRSAISKANSSWVGKLPRLTRRPRPLMHPLPYGAYLRTAYTRAPQVGMRMRCDPWPCTLTPRQKKQKTEGFALIITRGQMALLSRNLS
jgi:hypothetical protein